MQRRERDEPDERQRAGRDEVGARHAEEIAEQQSVEARRRGGRQRQEHAQAEEARDHHRDRCVAAEGRHAADERDPGRGHGDTGRSSDEQRQAEQRRANESGEQGVRERLRAVGELVEEDPAADDPTDDAEEHELEQRALHEHLAPRLPERVHQCSWWCGGRMPTSCPGSVTIAPP